jgi:outer membrane receptor protein involved in Fe transport
MFRSSVWPFAAISFALAFFDPGPSIAQETGSIEGRVLTRSGQPVEGARIQLDADSLAGRSDATGSYRLVAVMPGTHILVVRALGHELARRQVVVAANEVARVDVELAEAPLLLPDVVVSTNREEVRKAEVPANVGVVTAEDIRQARPHHPAEIVGRVPGVLVVDLGGEGHTVAMRQPINYNPVYAYLEDGVPIRSTGFFNHNALYEINIPESERIEVFKGPATALYGSDAIGGVVNVLTRPPSQASQLNLFAEGGRFGYGRFLGTASNTWGAQGLHADLNLTHFDGWRDGTSQDRQSGTIRHDWRLGADSRLKTVLTTSWIDSPGDGGSDVSRADFDARSTVNYTPIAFRKVEAIRLSSKFERERGPWLYDVTGYARHNRLELLPSWQLTYDPQVWDTKNRSVGLMAKVRRRFVPLRTSVIAGLDVDYSPGSRVIDEIIPVQTGPVFTSYTTGERQYDYDVTFGGVSPYLQASLTSWSRLHLSGGVRYDHVGYDYDTRLPELQTGPHRRPASTSVSFDHVTPNVGATWEFDRETSVFASYRHGFRVPSEDQLFVQGSATNSLGLDPVRANSYETGLRFGVGSWLQGEGSVYRMDMQDDILSFFNTTDFTSETSNAGRSRHWGVEAGLGLRWRMLRLEGGYSYNRHRYLEWVTSTGTDYSGNEMESGPRHLGNARVGYASARLSGTVEWVHVGRYFMDPENLHEYGGHDVINVYGSAPVWNRFDVVARLNNVGDVRYANTASYNPFVPAELRERLLPGLPRQLLVGVQYGLR